jgi:hypothetical protein
MMSVSIQSNSEAIKKPCYDECFYSMKFRSDKKLAMMRVSIQSNSEAVQKQLQSRATIKSKSEKIQKLLL